MDLLEALFYLVAVIVVYKFLDWAIRLPKLGGYAGRYIFITGCDTGFGRESAIKFDKLGCNVFATCMSEKGETELKKTCSSRLKTLHLDVSDHSSVEKALGFVKGHIPSGRGLWAVINNAGIGGRIFGPCEWLTLQDYMDMLAVNLLGVVDVSMTLLPLIKKEKGRLVNVASVHGRTSLIGNAPYSCSKYAVEAFTDNIRRQLRPFGCTAHLIEPGFHKTNIINSENIVAALNRAWDQATPETKEEYGKQYLDKALNAFLYKFVPKIASDKTDHVVDAYVHAVLGRRPRARYVIGIDAKYLWLPLQWAPEWLGDFLMEFLAEDAPIPAACK